MWYNIITLSNATVQTIEGIVFWESDRFLISTTPQQAPFLNLQRECDRSLLI